MSVHQLPDGRWFVQHRDPDRPGKFKREYFGRGIEAEAQARACNEASPHRPGTASRPGAGAARAHGGPTMADLIEAYQNAKSITMAKASRIALWYKAKKILLPAFGHILAYNLNDHLLDLFVARRLKSGVKLTTVRRDLSDVMAVLNWSCRRRMIMHNPVAGYAKPARDDAVIMPPTLAEVRRILAVSPAHLKRAIALVHYLGVRPGHSELLSITWDQVDLVAGLVTVVSAQKGGLRYRQVPIPPGLAAQMAAWRIDDGQWMSTLVHWRARPVERIGKAWRAALARAGITRRIRLYDLRHAMVTRALAAGAPLKAVSEVAGHTRTDTTTRIYQHVATADHRTVTDAIPDL
jgi:integrase